MPFFFPLPFYTLFGVHIFYADGYMYEIVNSQLVQFKTNGYVCKISNEMHAVVDIVIK
jgi:hypothetical protein